MHYQNSQSIVRCQVFDLIVIDVLVGEFHESIGSAIPKMIAHLTSFKLPSDVFEALANALTKFSEQGKVLNFLT